MEYWWCETGETPPTFGGELKFGIALFTPKDICFWLEIFKEKKYLAMKSDGRGF
jgi:hypothetical protein